MEKLAVAKREQDEKDVIASENILYNSDIYFSHAVYVFHCGCYICIWSIITSVFLA